MTEPPEQRFRRVAQSAEVIRNPRRHDRASFLESLDEIDHALDLATVRGRQGIEPRTVEYYTACMALIRLAALFEETAYEPLLRPATTRERRAIATMRNIAAHVGYREMDDELLWQTLTVDLPELVQRLRRAAS